MRWLAALVISLLAVVGPRSFAVAATGGTIDPSFGVRVVAFMPPSVGAAVALQPDGRIVVVGHSGSNPSTFAVARLLTSSSLDPSFGVGGKVRNTIASGAAATGVAVQPDGRIVVAGTSDSAPNNGVGQATLVRYEANGALDPGFGIGGVVITPPVTTAMVAALARQPDGRLVVVGRDDGAIMVRRYEADGAIDATFGTGGLVTTAIGTSARGLAVVLEPGGRIVVAGGTTITPGDEDFALVRYESDGTLDATFGSGGIATTAMPVTSEAAVALIRDAGGRLVVAGTVVPVASSSTSSFMMLARYDGAGVLDGSFGTGGIVVDTSIPAQAHALALQPDGKLVAAGASFTLFANFLFFGTAHFARYDDAGAPDPGFGTDGEASSPWGPISHVLAIALQGDGRIVAAGLVADPAGGPPVPLGSTNLRMAVARYFAGVCGDANQELGESCDDGNRTAGDCCSPTCDVDPMGTACDDGQSDICTAPDGCDGAGSCVTGGPVQCPPCETCNLVNGCELAVLPACKTPVAPGGARLALTNSTSPNRDRVQWKWSKGEATAVADFGTPNTSDDYDLCIFDATSQLAMSAELPAGGNCAGNRCWKPATKGFRYQGRDATPDGITGASLNAGDAGKANMKVDGKGENLVLPDLSMLSLPLRVQLQAENGQCWEATYSATGVSKNDGVRFKARSD